jgi:adenosylcobinamide-phosphate synthase
LPRSEIVRHVIEHSVLEAHRHVFGVLGWYSVLAAFGLGPAGAVIYRLSGTAFADWRDRSRLPGEGVSPALLQVARQAWGLIDYLPARMTALAFAVVGSFEDAVDSWRQCVAGFAGSLGDSVERNQAIVLAATAGAVNVRLGGTPLLRAIDARRHLSQARRSLAQARANRLQDLIGLYSATASDCRTAADD